MAVRMLLVIVLLIGHASLAWALPQQAPASISQETAVSAGSDSLKQASDQTPAAPKIDDKDQKEAKPQRKVHVQLGTVSFGRGYSYFSGPYYYPYRVFGFYPYGMAYPAFFCDPFWCAPTPLLSPVYSGSLAYAEDKGEV